MNRSQPASPADAPGMPGGKRAAILGLVVLIAGLAFLIARFAKGWDETGQAGDAAESPAERKHVLKILFIGNSYTSANDLPGTLEALAKAAGEDPHIRVQAILTDAATLQIHWDSGGAAEIRRIDWDYVVLQEQSATPLAEVGRDALFFPYSRRFNEVIQARGAKTLFYMTWRRPGGGPPQESWTRPYLDIARELDARVAPAGMALELVMKRKPEFRFYADPGGHPTPAGTYLVACTFYAAIYNKSPAGLPASVTTSGQLPVGVPPEDAPIVQGAAWEAVALAKNRLSAK